MLNSYFDNIAMTLDVKENVYNLHITFYFKEIEINEVIIEICSLILKKLELTMT